MPGRRTNLSHKLPVKNGIGFISLMAALVILVFASPFAVRWIAESGKDWSLLSSVGQTYGFAAALLAGLAFAAIAISLFYQARQTTVAQLQAARTFQLELFRLAYEHPDLQDTWYRSDELPLGEWRKRTYINLVFMYLRMSYLMREITDAGLHRSMANRFRTQLGRTYWLGARQAFETGIKDSRDKRFFQIADHEYEEAIQNTPLKEPTGTDPRKLGIHPVVTFTAGGATVAVVSLLLRLRKRRS
jgi:hypothetical protein